MQITDSDGNILYPDIDGTEIIFENGDGGDVLLSGELDEDTHTVIDFSADPATGVAKVERVQPLGKLTGLLLCQTADGSQAAQGDTALLVGVFADQTKCLFTQDGLTVISGEYEGGVNKSLKVKDANSTPFSVATVLPHTNKPSTGPLANLPVVPIRTYREEDQVYRFSAQYQPNSSTGEWTFRNTNGYNIITDNYTGDVYIAEILE